MSPPVDSRAYALRAWRLLRPGVVRGSEDFTHIAPSPSVNLYLPNANPAGRDSIPGFYDGPSERGASKFAIVSSSPRLYWRLSREIAAAAGASAMRRARRRRMAVWRLIRGLGRDGAAVKAQRACRRMAFRPSDAGAYRRIPLKSAPPWAKLIGVGFVKYLANPYRAANSSSPHPKEGSSTHPSTRRRRKRTSRRALSTTSRR